VALRDRELYKEDYLGLKKLDKAGGLHFKTTPGEHMQIDDQVLNDTMKEFFGPYGKKFGKESAIEFGEL